MTGPTPATVTAVISAVITAAEFEELIQNSRPALHRYATRMTGSVIDGEDVVQEALVKAYSSLPLLAHNTNLRGWLFRITYNKAIDHLRRNSDEPMELLDEYPMTEETDSPLEERELAALALSKFLKLAPKQRSCVILKDVLDYSLVEISELLDATVPEIKAALHRGRTRLRELAESTDYGPRGLDGPWLNKHEQERLARYVERFNARDFDAVRSMLADEVRLDVVGRAKVRGIDEVADRYFHNYSEAIDWRLAVGTVEGHPAILVYDPGEILASREVAQPVYFVLLTWDNDRVVGISDYRFARYVLRDAAITLM